MSNEKDNKVAWDELILSNFLGILVLISLIVTNLGIILRYVFEISMPWNEEVVKAIFIWMIFIGFALSYRSDSLAGIILLEDSLKSKGKIIAYKMLKSVQILLALGFGLYASYCSYDIASFQIETGELTTVVEMPIYFVSSGMLIGYVLFSIYGLMHLYKTWRS